MDRDNLQWAVTNLAKESDGKVYITEDDGTRQELVTPSFTGAVEITGSISASTTITAGAGAIVTSGGLTVTAGGILVTAGGLHVVAGNIKENGSYYHLVKSAVFTLGGPWNTGECDFEFVSVAADHVAENLDLGALIPAKARVLDVSVRCSEAFVTAVPGVVEMLLLVGNASAGNQFIASASCNTLNEVIGMAAAGACAVAISNAVQNIWVQGDPDTNWDTISAGRLQIVITYLDLGVLLV